MTRVRSLSRYLTTIAKGEGVRRELIRGGLGGGVVKLAQTITGVVLATTLARLLGPDGYGVYSFVMAVIMMLGIPAQAGIPQLTVRETAKFQAGQAWEYLEGLWRWGSVLILALSTTVALVAALVVWTGSARIADTRVFPLAVGLLLLPLIGFVRVRSAALSGLRRVVLGQVPERILRPITMLFLVLAVSLVYAPEPISPNITLVLNGIAFLLAFAFAHIFLAGNRPLETRPGVVPRYQPRRWQGAMLSLAAINGLHVINGNADVVLLGLFRTDTDVGIYRAMVQISILVSFGLGALSQVLQPYMSRLYARGELANLQRMVAVAGRVIIAIAIAPVLVFVFFGDVLTGFLFGQQYQAGSAALAILALGQLVNVALGPVGMILAMTGHERDALRGLATGATVNILLNIVLIPYLGLEGAALASFASLFIWNSILRRCCLQRIGIETCGLLVRPAPAGV